MRLFCSLIVLLLVASCYAKCPNVPVVSPFDVSEYLGIWYEIATTPTSLDTFERNCYCTRANYTLEDNGNVSVQNSCNLGSTSGPLSVANGTAYIEDPTQPAKLSVTFGSPFLAPYWVIINEDYESAVVWSCVSVGLINVEYMWVLSRDNTMSQQQYDMLTQQAADITGYNIDRLVTTDQQGCSYPQKL